MKCSYTDIQQGLNIITGLFNWLMLRKISIMKLPSKLKGAPNGKVAKTLPSNLWLGLVNGHVT